MSPEFDETAAHAHNKCVRFSLVTLWGKRLALLGASVLVVLVLAELGLRHFAPLYQANDPAAYIYDAQLGFRLRDNYYSLNTTDFQQEIRTNSQGLVSFRDDFTSYPKLVFAVGDSFTQGTGLPVDASYPFQLDLLLNRDEQGLYAPRYGTLNLGVGGYGGEQSLLLMQRVAQNLRPPDVILYLGCDNDYEDDQLFLSGYQHRHLVAGSPYWGRWVGAGQWLTNDFQLGLRAKLAFGRMRRQRILSASQAAASTTAAPSVAEREAQVLERLASYAHAHNAQLVVGWSSFTASYDWLRNWAAQRNISFADWRGRSQSVQSGMPHLTVGNPHSGGHYRAWVNHLIAEEFARHLK